MSIEPHKAEGKKPAHPFDKRWHLYVDGETLGPYTGHQIKDMATQGEVLEDDLVYAEDGTDWVQISSDPILSSLFKSVEAPLLPSSIRRDQPRRYRLWLFVIPVLIAALWTAWPFYAAYDLAGGVRRGDIATLEARVAWDSVRRGLRDDLNAILLQVLKKDAKNDGNILGAAFATVIGPAIVDRMVDSFVTPQAFALSNAEKNKPSTTVNAPTNDSKALKIAQRVNWSQIKYAFFSGGPFSFRIDVLPDRDFPFKDPLQLRFQWDGNWRLARIILPADAIDILSDPTKSKELAADERLSDLLSDQKKEKKSPANSKPQPLSVTLVSKGFEAADYRANKYQARITLRLQISNKLPNDIRAFDGVLRFTDLLDNDIMSIKMAVNEPLKANADMSWEGTVDFNQFQDSDRRLRDAEKQNMKVSFSARKILFADGNTKEY